MLTARKYELYRELTSDSWRHNLINLSYTFADIMDANSPDMECSSFLPYFDRQLGCGDRLRYTAHLLELTYGYNSVPIYPPLSAQALLGEDIATTCRPSSTSEEQGFNHECIIDTQKLRKQLASALVELSAEVGSDREEAVVSSLES